MSKFQALKELIENAAPALKRNADDAAASIAAKTATAEEKEFLDMLQQEIAAKDAFKSEFNLPVAHGTSKQKILKNMDLLDKYKLAENIGVDSPRQIPTDKIPLFKEFKVNDSFNGEGIFSHPYDKIQKDGMGPNYKPNEYATGEGSMILPLRVRGAKTFNSDGHINYKESELIPTVQESFDKLSKLSGKSVEELKNLTSYELRKIVERYPEEFENFTFQGQVVTFKPENIRGEFAEYDPLKRKSRDYMSSIAAAAGLGALTADEAKADILRNLTQYRPEQKEFSFEDQLNLQKDKLKEAGKIMSEPAEYDELDTSGYLPNQQMAGQGLQKALRAALELQPREEEMPAVYKDPISGKDVRFDPTGITTSGNIIKFPKIKKITQKINNETPTKVINLPEKPTAQLIDLPKKLPDEINWDVHGYGDEWYDAENIGWGITKDGPKEYSIINPSGKTIAEAKSLREAKELAEELLRDSFKKPKNK